MAQALCSTGRRPLLFVLLLLAVINVVESSPLPFISQDKCLDKQPLDEYIQHYEPAHYDLDEFVVRHKRAAAVPDGNEDIQVKFHAHGRHFHLMLKPDTSDLTSHAEIHIRRNNEIVNETLEYNPNSFMTGYVHDDHKSFVSAWNDDGVISANIHCSDGSYYLKPARDHFNTSQLFHSVIYRSADISPWPVSMLRNETLRAKLEKQSHCGVAPDTTSTHVGHSHDILEEDFRWKEKHFGKKTSSAGRQKRASNRRSANFVCTLNLYADYHFYSLRAGSDTSRAISIMRQHVNKAINIFSTTDFDDNGAVDGFFFKIGRITVVTDTNTPPFTGATSTYQTAGADGNLESSVDRNLFLKMFSTVEGNELFCESILFTYLDFPEGILGLAYVGGVGGNNGICSRKGFLQPTTFRGRTYTQATLNTGFVTFINHGLRQNDGLTEIVFSHELGHNWGSTHDDSNAGQPCLPTDGNGNYLMYSRATDGTQKNNAVFSRCSRVAINNNIVNLLQRNPPCFTDDPSAFCGNGIVEDGEECDCGTFTCKDPCCNPYNVSTPKTNCKVKTGSDCSPEKGECCSMNCSFTNTGKDEIPCGDADSCQIQSLCSNLSAECPGPKSRADNILCTPTGTANMTLNFRQACLSGFCSESACVSAGYRPCSCGAKSCQLCCNVNGQCVNTHTTNVTGNNVVLSKVYLSPGRACNNYNGQCTKTGVCEPVDLNSSLDDVTNLFDKEAINAIVAWLKNNWFWVLVIIAAIVVLALAVHFSYKYKQNHTWEESKAAARAKTMRIGKSLRGPDGKGKKAVKSLDVYDSGKCARRLAKMFPLADYTLVTQTAQDVDNEEAAVVKLLDDGQRMCKW